MLYVSVCNHRYFAAIKMEKTNASLVWSRCELLERLGETQRVMDGYQMLLPLLTASDGERYIHLATLLTKVGEYRNVLFSS